MIRRNLKLERKSDPPYPDPISTSNVHSSTSYSNLLPLHRSKKWKIEQEKVWKSTDIVALKNFDLKSALFKHMNKIKSANRNTTNYRLYHALIEALITDEDAMDKEVADKVNKEKGILNSAASGSAHPPPKDDVQSSKKPRESDASATKQHPAFTSSGWQITDTRDAGADSSMHRSDPESEHSEQSYR
ncbi:hypothetical protein Tco_0426306 [Tanacetum coccineum]